MRTNIAHEQFLLFVSFFSRCLILSSALSFAQAIPFDAVCGSVLFFVFRFPVQQTFYRVAIYIYTTPCMCEWVRCIGYTICWLQLLEYNKWPNWIKGRKKSIRKLNTFGSVLESAIQFERISFEQNGRQ